MAAAGRARRRSLQDRAVFSRAPRAIRVTRAMEHYCTLFDETFLPQGIALHASLERHAQPFTLWVLCLDRPTKTALDNLRLSEVRTLALTDCETPELLAA